MESTGPDRTPCEPGGLAPTGWIPLCVPEIMGNEHEYLNECLDSNWVSSAGPFVDRFEREIALQTGCRHAVATSTGTAALHVALLVAGVGEGDEVIVPSLTFIAPANAVRYVGAWPVFIDAEPDYWQMDVQKLERFLESDCSYRRGKLVNKASRRHIRAVVPVHLLGHPVDMDPLLDLARRYELAVIEDATESLGAKYKGRAVGHLGDIACFSFNGNKIITTGGGGMIVTDREDWAARARYLTTQAKDDPLEYVHREVGFNYRLTNIQAALGCAQLETLSKRIEAKRRIAAKYAAALEHIEGISAMREAPWASSIFWAYTVLVDSERYGMDSRALLKRLGSYGVQARPLWQPMHESPAHATEHAMECAVASRLNRLGLTLPCSVGLTSSDQQRVISVLHGESPEVMEQRESAGAARR